MFMFDNTVFHAKCINKTCQTDMVFSGFFVLVIRTKKGWFSGHGVWPVFIGNYSVTVWMLTMRQCDGTESTAVK